jgi:hypothetical protein
MTRRLLILSVVAGIEQLRLDLLLHRFHRVVLVDNTRGPELLHFSTKSCVLLTILIFVWCRSYVDHVSTIRSASFRALSDLEVRVIKI